MVYEAIEQNKRNTFFLIFMFVIIISALGYFIGELYGNPYTGLIIAFVIAIFSSWSSYYYSDSIVMSVSGAVPADRAMYTQLHNSVEGLALAAGIKPPRIYVVDSPAMNAFATGRDPDHSAIAVTTGLYKALDKFELEAVIAHEMSHIKNYDILIGTVAAILLGMIVILADIIKRNVFRTRMRSTGGRAGILFLAVMILAALLTPFIATIISYAMSRQREYLADAQGVKLTRYPQGLINALTKIQGDTAPVQEINRGLAHLYFSVPVRMEASSLFSTHPPITKRIERLRGM
ncbi:MAG: M48 family metalloprotease [Spirochaetia bacterium]|nr:M48 family metalloprotease [Spirochaetia bacterium]